LSRDPDKLRRAGLLVVYRLLGKDALVKLFGDSDEVERERLWREALKDLHTWVGQGNYMEGLHEVAEVVPIPDSLKVENELWSRPEWRTTPGAKKGAWLKFPRLTPKNEYAPKEPVVARLAGQSLSVVVFHPSPSAGLRFYLFEDFKDTSRPTDAMFDIFMNVGQQYKVVATLKSMLEGKPAGGFFELVQSSDPGPTKEVLAYAREHRDRFSPVPIPDGLLAPVTVSFKDPEEAALYYSVFGSILTRFPRYGANSPTCACLTLRPWPKVCCVRRSFRIGTKETGKVRSS